MISVASSSRFWRRRARGLHQSYQADSRASRGDVTDPPHGEVVWHRVAVEWEEPGDLRVAVQRVQERDPAERDEPPLRL